MRMSVGVFWLLLVSQFLSAQAASQPMKTLYDVIYQHVP